MEARPALSPLFASPTPPSRSVCVVYLLDSQFVVDAPKFIAGCLARPPRLSVPNRQLSSRERPSKQASLSSMLQLELPHVSVLTKVDLLADRRALLDECASPVLPSLHCSHLSRPASCSQT
jgi:hypothetical protein